MPQPTVSILIPNYKTKQLTQLCLRLLKKYTNLDEVKIIVIDNDSQDESTQYLRQLKGIELIERPALPGETGPLAHAAALDLGLARVTTPYVLSIHTDTLVKHPDWLPFLISEIERRPSIAGVGSWKLEFKSFLARQAKTIEFYLQQGAYKLIGKDKHALAGVGENFLYLRSHCALYRTDLLRDLGLSFAAEGEVAGKILHKALLNAGYEMIFLRPEVLVSYLEHLNHATMVLNEEFAYKAREKEKGLKRIYEGLARLQAEKILADETLDFF